MASDAVIAPPRDHSTPKLSQKKYGSTHLEGHERKSLQTLQPSAAHDKALVGVGQTPSSKNNKPCEKTKIKPTHGPVKVYHDSNLNKKATEEHKQASSDYAATQTDDCLLEDLIQERLQERQVFETASKRVHSFVETEEDEAYELMIKEPVPESYWKEIAEQRRLALNDTLEENRSLHQEIDSLREENEKLSELASQAAALSSLLQSVVSDTEDRDEGAEEKETEGGAKGADTSKPEDNQTSKDAHHEIETKQTPGQETESQISPEKAHSALNVPGTVKSDQQNTGESAS